MSRSGCPLVLEPKPSTIGNRVRTGSGFVYYLGGGMLWRCGNAEMEADSAVRFETEGRIEMLGNVLYRDTIRTLQSNLLTYFEAQDSVIATGNVLLTRLASGSTVEAPQVHFLRALSSREAVTTATGRPHMTLYSDRERAKPPFEVDADKAVLAGEEEARAWGRVIIRRPDLEAHADSVHFDIRRGGGTLFGAPRLQGNGFVLEGDTVRLGFEESDLREVWARGEAKATGESYEIEADHIRAVIVEERAEDVWAFGPDGAEAVSSSYRLVGDSLHIAMRHGEVDTVVSVGRAAAIDVSGAKTPQTAEAALPPEDSLQVPGEEEPGQEEALRKGPLQGAEAAVNDSMPVPGDAEADSVVGRGRFAVGRPGLSIEGTANWLTGDTLYAVFEPVPESVQTDSGPRRRVKRIRVVAGEEPARAYYATVADSSRTRRLSRNYLLGKEIEIVFRDGRVQTVRGEKAIGVYLDPIEQPEAEAGPAPPPRSGAPSAGADQGRAGGTVPSFGRGPHRTGRRR